jgi:hypothetical protein
MQMNYKTKEQRILVATVPLETFFNIFVSMNGKEGDAKITSELEEAYQAAEDFYELVQNPLASYLGRCQNLALINDGAGLSCEGIEYDKLQVVELETQIKPKQILNPDAAP